MLLTRLCDASWETTAAKEIFTRSRSSGTCSSASPPHEMLHTSDTFTLIVSFQQSQDVRMLAGGWYAFGQRSVERYCCQNHLLGCACCFTGLISWNLVGKSLACSAVVQRCDGVSQKVSAPAVPCLPGFHRFELSFLTVRTTWNCASRVWVLEVEVLVRPLVGKATMPYLWTESE